METKSKIKEGEKKLETMSGEIEFENVHFTYPSRPGEKVLKGLNLKIKPNKMTAIVGDSGAGKSTISKLVMRMYDPQRGCVKIDGHDLRSLNLRDVHQKIGIVSQSPDLFDVSLEENIAYGSVSADWTRADVEQAAKIANCDFISKFRAGLDAFAGGQGLQLSGGQKQRIAIARAAIRNPDVLILDEATSALDAENEKVVQEALENIMRGQTVLVIAHRLSTIKNADEILCMKDGDVVEKGTHQELMLMDGVYANLVRKQLVDEQKHTKTEEPENLLGEHNQVAMEKEKEETVIDEHEQINEKEKQKLDEQKQTLEEKEINDANVPRNPLQRQLSELNRTE